MLRPGLKAPNASDSESEAPGKPEPGLPVSLSLGYSIFTSDACYYSNFRQWGMLLS